jgi:predicted lipoprotein with Yx(FWY)xxD motif
MNRLIAVSAGVAAFAAVAAGCSSNSGSTTPAATSSAPASSAPSSAPAGTSGAAAGGAATVKVANSADGQILVDGSGRTLYLFEADKGTVSSCNGACATAWPPETTTGTPQATGVSASMVGESTRADKSTQVTVGGHPLYYFADDTKAGDINGQGVNAFGGLWYLVGPSGAAVTTTASSGTPATTSGGYGSGY